MKATTADEIILNPRLSSEVLRPKHSAELDKFVTNIPQLFNYLPQLNSIKPEEKSANQNNVINTVNYRFDSVNVDANDIDGFISSIQQFAPQVI